MKTLIYVALCSLMLSISQDAFSSDVQSSFDVQSPKRSLSYSYPLTYDDWENGFFAGHGLLHGALNAANLNDAKSAESKLLRMMKTDFFFGSLASAHYNDFRVFCTDVCHAVPGIIMEMLVNSKNDVIELLPALPENLSTGSVSGLKTRNRVTIENMTWDMNKKEIVCRLNSDIEQDIMLIQRNGIASVSGGKAKISASPSGNNDARLVHLPKGIVTLSIKLNTNN